MSDKKSEYSGSFYIRDELLEPYYISISRGQIRQYSIMRNDTTSVIGHYSNIHSALRAALEYKLNNNVFKEGQEVTLEAYISSIQSAYDSLGHIMNKVLNKYAEIKNETSDE